MRFKKDNSYREIKEYVNTLNIAYNGSFRGDCPACGGNGTFTATNSNGRLLWYCFRASCNTKGSTKGKITLFSAEEFLEPKQETVKSKKVSDFIGWDANVAAYPHAMFYLYKNNCTETYKFDPHRFFYDKTNDRLVFVSYDTPNTVKLATGRSLGNSTPKWYKYIALQGEYFEAPTYVGGETNTVFICEDCASACSLSRLEDAIALCGTSYNLYSLINKLNDAYYRVVICLDKDAQMIALKLKRDLEAVGDFKEVVIKSLSDDAKYLDINTLKKELGYNG